MSLNSSETEDDLENPGTAVEMMSSPDSPDATISTAEFSTAKRHRSPFRAILQPMIILTLICHATQALHISSFNSLWFTHLSTSRSSLQSQPKGHSPFHFTGGLALEPTKIGLVLACLGTIGILMQLLIYPTLTSHFGTVKTWRLALFCFPIAYFITPFLSIVPTASPPPHASDGWRVYLSILSVLFIQVLGRTFALPATVILVNNAAPSHDVLGTLHGVAQSVNSGARTLGPVIGGWAYGRGLEDGVVGAVWWAVAVVAAVGILESWFVREGKGPMSNVISDGNISKSGSDEDNGTKRRHRSARTLEGEYEVNDLEVGRANNVDTSNHENHDGEKSVKKRTVKYKDDGLVNDEVAEGEEEEEDYSDRQALLRPRC